MTRCVLLSSVGGIHCACLALFTYFEGNGGGRSRALTYGAGTCGAAACKCSRYAATVEETRAVRQCAVVSPVLSSPE